MNKLTQDQSEKLEQIYVAVEALGDEPIDANFASKRDLMNQACVAFTTSLPFKVDEEQLNNMFWWYGAPRPNDWRPETILERKVLVLLNALDDAKRGESIMRLAGDIQSVLEAVENVMFASDAEYPDDTPQFDGDVVQF